MSAEPPPPQEIPNYAGPPPGSRVFGCLRLLCLSALVVLAGSFGVSTVRGTSEAASVLRLVGVLGMFVAALTLVFGLLVGLLEWVEARCGREIGLLVGLLEWIEARYSRGHEEDPADE